MRDLRVAVRSLLKARGLALAALLTLGLGIGASTVVFTVVNALVLRPLPFGARTPRLVTLHSTHPTQAPDFSRDDSEMSYPDLLDLREQSRTLATVEAVLDRNFSLVGTDGSERVLGASVTPGLFAMLGVAPRLGRGFAANEGAEPGQENVALISDALWQRRFAGDPTVVGKPVPVNGRQVRVIGVMPTGFRFPDRHDLWLPYAAPRDEGRGRRGLWSVALLREGSSTAAAQSELDALAGRLATRHPETNRGWGVFVQGMHATFVDAGTRASLGSMLAAVLLVLLVACANIAGLLLARGIARQQELTVRAALGAGRRHLVRLLLLESLLLALGGAALGVALARWGLAALIAANPDPPPYWASLAIDRTTLWFVGGLCLLATLACGLVPALRISRLRIRDGLAVGGRAGIGLEQRRAQAALVVAQIAASLALLVGATLLMRSAVRIDGVSGGFDARPLLSLRLYLPGDAYDDNGAKARALARIGDRLAALPGAERAAAIGAIPTDDGGATEQVVPSAEVPASEAIGVQMVPVTPGIWATLDVPLAGRTFTAAEAVDEEADVAIVNRRLAAAFWPGADPLGRRLGLLGSEGTRWLRVVGVAPDLIYEEVGEVTPQASLTLYRPAAAVGWRTMAMLVRAKDPGALASSVPRVLREVDPNLAAYDVLTMEQRRVVTAWGERFMGRMFGAFALASLLLACVGTYGLISYTAGRRRREMGVRQAIGAGAGDIVKLLLGEGVRLAAIGMVLGLPLAVLAARALRDQLFEGSPWDPGVWLTLPLTLLGAVLLACYLPARRASRVEPSSALRQD